MDKTEIIEKLQSYKKELQKIINLKKMILFGSYSQDYARPDSDIDVALVVEKIQGDYLNFLTLIWKIGGDTDPRIEPIVFEENQPDYSGFLETILNTGIEIN
ncbi:MAG: nucleotidyltransferase domain-containing protein [Candidatus Kapabacteria bacterium]|nr:nucleotidyltransferase domain-containing protein [Candidatus Kapabacteria bacterium]